MYRARDLSIHINNCRVIYGIIFWGIICFIPELVWPAYVIGFSEDGKSAAFVDEQVDESNAHDAEGDFNAGSVWAMRTLYFIDVKKNKWAKPPSIYEALGENPINGSRPFQPMTDTKIKDLGISSRFKGENLVITRRQEDPKIASFLFGGNEYQIVVRELPGDAKGCFDRPKISPTMISLKVINLSKHTEHLLQEDKKIPLSRGCPQGYRIEAIHAYRDSVVILLGFVQFSKNGGATTIGISGALP